MLTERRCALCLVPFVPHSPAPFCAACLADLLRSPKGRCPRCGLSMPAEGVFTCGRCLQDPPPWEQFVGVGPYEQQLRELLIRAKFHADTAALHGLGVLMALAVQQELSGIEVIVPMPLHPARLRERGFNQCVELSRPISRVLGVPVRNDFLVRQRDTPHQRGLSAQERRRNLRGAFVVPDRIVSRAGTRVLLVDDVMTTGTTLRLATKVLVEAGAVVDVVAAARA